MKPKPTPHSPFLMVQIKWVLSIIIFLTCLQHSVGQQQNILSQYFQVMQSFAPALVGANEYMDLRVGYRNQWAGTNQAPKSYFVGIDAELFFNRINPHKYNSVRVSDLSPYAKKNLKFGVGGYVINNRSGLFNETESMLSMSMHLLVSRNLYLSFGTSNGFYSGKIDVSNLSVLRPENDDVYQAYLSANGQTASFESNLGLGLYSSRFYVSYGIIRVIEAKFNSIELASRKSKTPAHNLVGGVRLNVSQNFELVPNFFVRHSRHLPIIYDVGTRVKYKEVLMAGLSYRSDKSYIGLLGLSWKNKYSFSYSYELKSSNAIVNSLSSHEIVLGMLFFNTKKYHPIW